MIPWLPSIPWPPPVPLIPAPPPRQIGAATPEDIPALADIHAAAFAIGWSADEIARLANQPGVTLLVARRASLWGSRRAVGFCLFRTAADEAELLTIAVHPRHRGSGVGRLLVEEMLRRLYADRVEAVFLEVGPDNAAALALYERLGFRKVGERPAYYRTPDGPPRAALVMRLAIGGA